MKHHFILATLLLATNALAAGEPLVTDLGFTGGGFRRCQYIDGQIVGVPATKSCPTVKPPVPDSGKGRGFLSSIKVEGSTKRCIYKVGSVDREIRIPQNDGCPTNQLF